MANQRTRADTSSVTENMAEIEEDFYGAFPVTADASPPAKKTFTRILGEQFESLHKPLYDQ